MLTPGCGNEAVLQRPVLPGLLGNGEATGAFITLTSW